jgi:hypothetical protein
MKTQIFTPTKDNELNKIVEDYMIRQRWMINFINPKNKKYNYVEH